MKPDEFKKNVRDFLIAKGFVKKGSYYYLFVQNIIIVIGLQKSNYSNGYYINVGYVISKLNPDILTPRDVDGDIRVRFSIEENGKRNDLFDLNKLLRTDSLIRFLDENVECYIKNITSLERLRIFMEKNPTVLYQTKLAAKQLLGFEDDKL